VSLLTITPASLEAIAVSRFVRSRPDRHTIVDPLAAFRAMPFGARRQWIEEVCDDVIAAQAVAKQPKIVCLCGSTKFWREFQKAGLRETLAGNIVLSIGAASGTDDEHFTQLPAEEWQRVKTGLDELHFRKIDLADEILVLNLGGYIGDSTRREIEYAQVSGKPIRYLEAMNQPVPAQTES
jgi:hypothetical protein